MKQCAFLSLLCESLLESRPYLITYDLSFCSTSFCSSASSSYLLFISLSVCLFLFLSLSVFSSSFFSHSLFLRPISSVSKSVSRLRSTLRPCRVTRSVAAGNLVEWTDETGLEMSSLVRSTCFPEQAIGSGSRLSQKVDQGLSLSVCRSASPCLTLPVCVRLSLSL